MMYNELDDRNLDKMCNMIASGTSFAVYVYILIGTIGYITFLNDKSDKWDKDNSFPKDITLAPYKHV